MVSCKKDLQKERKLNQELKVDETKIFKRPETSEEKALVANLSKTTDILKEVYKSKDAVREVNASIAAKVYTDESILLAELIYPNTGILGESKKFKLTAQKFNIRVGLFADLFWKEVAKKNDPSYLQFLDDLKKEIVKLTPNFSSNSYQTDSEGGNGVSIYFPYQNEFIDPNDPGGGGGYTYGGIVSVVTATADADEGLGNQPVYDAQGNLVGYTQVLVNDDYVFNNPSHIIGVNGIEPLDPNRVDSITPPPPPPPAVNRIYIGEGICKEQYDRLISFTGNGGGSEMKYCHLTGYLQPVNGQVTSFQDIISLNFTRSEIRNKKWIRTMAVWDDDWVIGETEQVLGIYEEDNTNSRTFTGSLSVKLDSLGIPVQGTIGYSITVLSQDDIIRQLKISRTSYFAGAFVNQGQDFTNDRTFIPSNQPSLKWPAYDVHYWNKSGVNVGWTWPYNKL